MRNSSRSDHNNQSHYKEHEYRLCLQRWQILQKTQEAHMVKSLVYLLLWCLRIPNHTNNGSTILEDKTFRKNSKCNILAISQTKFIQILLQYKKVIFKSVMLLYELNVEKMSIYISLKNLSCMFCLHICTPCLYSACGSQRGQQVPWN